jgi:hypothetical protein
MEIRKETFETKGLVTLVFLFVFFFLQGILRLFVHFHINKNLKHVEKEV